MNKGRKRGRSEPGESVSAAGLEKRRRRGYMEAWCLLVTHIGRRWMWIREILQRCFSVPRSEEVKRR